MSQHEAFVERRTDSQRLTRRSLVAGAGAAAAGVALGTGRSTAKAAAVIQDKITIPLFTSENDPNTLAFYENTIKAFQEQVDPNVELEIALYRDENQLEYLTTAFETGTDLGIFSPPDAQVPDWVAQGHLLPLTSMIQEIGVDDFIAGTRVVIDGEDYLMPYQANASALWCRVDLLEQEGLKPPTTYEEYLAAAQALHGKDGLIGVASAVGTVPAMTLQFFTPYIHQAGWDYYDQAGNLTFDQPGVLEAVRRFADIMRNTSPSFYNGTFADILNVYAAGRAVFGTFPGRLGVNTAEVAPDIAEKSTVVPVPAGPFMTGKLLFGGVEHYAIHAKTAYPEEAQAFLKFMTTAERALEFSMTVPGHILPALQSVRTLVPSYQSDYMSAHGDWVIALNEMVPDAFSPDLSMGAVNNNQYLGRISNYCPWGAAIWGSPPVDGTMFQEILIEGSDPEQAWAKAAETMGQAAAAWKAQNPDWTPPSPVASPTA